MRVLIVNTLYPPDQVGGAERSVAQLAEGLARRGAQASVLALHPRPDADVDEREGLTVRRLPLRNSYWPYAGARPSFAARAAWHGLEACNPLMERAVNDAVSQARPDLVHLHLTTGFSLSVYHAARRQGVPLVQTLRDWSMMCARASLFRRGRRCERRCASCVWATMGKRILSQGARHVIGLSAPVLEGHLAAGYFRQVSASVIGNAASSTGRALRPSLTAEPTMTFGFLGRIEPEKGIEVLLKAVRGLDGDWCLRIAGRGASDYVARLQRDYADARIDWLGQSEADRFWPTIDVLAAPSIWVEPFGRAVVEAIQQGRGVIASCIGGLPDAAKGGGTVALIAPGDVDALRAAMRAVMASPARWRFATNRPPLWTEASIVETHLAVYQQALSTNVSKISAERDQA